MPSGFVAQRIAAASKKSSPRSLLAELAAKKLETIQQSRIEPPCIDDFEQFCGLVDIVPKSGGGRVKLAWNEVQRRYNESRTSRDISLKPRQAGFTTNECARDVWHLLTVPGARVVVVCQSSDDNVPAKLLSSIYRVMFDGLRSSGVPLDFRTEAANEWVLADRDASLRIIVAGASEASASKKGRAGTITRLHLTETAYYDYAEETLNALLECVPGAEQGSEIVSESTPHGAQGLFYRQCKAAQSGDSEYKFHFFPWFMASEYAVSLEPGERIEAIDDEESRLVDLGCKPEQLKWRRRKVAEKGLQLFSQEYPSDPDTCFLVSGRSFFDEPATSKLIEAATREPIETRMRGRVRIWSEPDPAANYVLSVDTSEGGGGDPSGALMYRSGTGEHVATIDGDFTPLELAAKASALGHEYNGALIAVERNNHGHAVLQSLDVNHNYPNIYKHDDGKPGYPTTAVTRPVMLDELEDAHRKGIWRSPDRGVLKQMRTFVVGNGGKAQAARGEHDDLVLAAAIGWSVLQRPRMRIEEPDPNLEPLSRWDDDDFGGRGF